MFMHIFQRNTTSPDPIFPWGGRRWGAHTYAKAASKGVAGAPLISTNPQTGQAQALHTSWYGAGLDGLGNPGSNANPESRWAY